MTVRHVLGGHSAANLKVYLEKIFSEFSIQSKLGFFTTDNVETMSKVVKDIGLKRVPCLVHILHLIVANSFKFVKKCSVSSVNNLDDELDYANDKQIEESTNLDLTIKEIHEENLKEIKTV